MGFLLDTNVISELRKAAPDAHVSAWRDANAHAEAYVSVLVLGELRQGIERLRRRDPARAEGLDRWLRGVARAYSGRVLPVTTDVADAWGRLNVPPRVPPVVDGLLAATALVHRLTLVTRNVADVKGTGVRVLNPFVPA